MQPSHPTRREFAATLAAAALTACAGRTVSAPSTATPAPSSTSAGEPPKPDTLPTKRDANAPLADHLLGVVVARYGGSVDADHRKDVRGGILHTLQLSDRLRKVSLPNSVDPFSSLCIASGTAATGSDR